ncbi:phosphatase domain-containing protein [Mycobacteroides immunogenum]|uniref:Polynucleotide kinase n=1 Tax=Mycobacteroides immunogenum TaxID=83262 RepID=A0A7V8RXB2_9MYCO|nr:AAA family ATPase [Mycobacteroides immunogenum]KPG13719.1 polynucleotide kinase [Mycobacteroides immunogenum]KPG14292.1 polynucleotide kinase [Mycobacteroides immunogenum]KPG14362.1 polynucleotide kinase [Mycobacteroides immunogenum]KPG17433.1 polynucleotide kinase [Mycobacteroides immunogenum]KPG23983.1 polynucleotide kinase [Mycobacteroides immunogenum]
MTALICMRGYVASGKSTRAREIAKETGAVVVNRDLLRLQLLGSYWTGDPDDESRVSVAEEAQVLALMNAGVPVVVDATHLVASYLRKWARMATRYGWEFHVEDVPTPMDVCLERLRRRNRESDRIIEASVLFNQAKRFPINRWPVITKREFNPIPVGRQICLPRAIIVDIDGTLAEKSDRSPYDYSRVYEDGLYQDIAFLIDRLTDNTSYYTLIVSGRDDTCRDETMEWLVSHGIYYDELLMRETEVDIDEFGGKLPDFEVKYRLFDEYIRDKWCVDFVIDDRRQVIDMWRGIGLRVLDVAGNDF